MLWLLACWQPPATVPPVPVQVEASDVLEGTADEIRPGGAEVPEGLGAAEGDDPEVEDDVEDRMIERWEADHAESEHPDFDPDAELPSDLASNQADQP